MNKAPTSVILLLSTIAFCIGTYSALSPEGSRTQQLDLPSLFFSHYADAEGWTVSAGIYDSSMLTRTDVSQVAFGDAFFQVLAEDNPAKLTAYTQRITAVPTNEDLALWVTVAKNKYDEGRRNGRRLPPRASR